MPLAIQDKYIFDTLGYLPIAKHDHDDIQTPFLHLKSIVNRYLFCDKNDLYDREESEIRGLNNVQFFLSV